MKVLLSLALLCLLYGCGESTPEFALQTPDRMEFENEVYPVLLRDCAFSACHASSDRFFQVYGPGRTRLDPMTQPLDPATPSEIERTYERTRSMIDVAQPEQSLLLRKPLETSAGGTGHEGADDLGRNVYQSKTDPNYLILQAWVLAAPPQTASNGAP